MTRRAAFLAGLCACIAVAGFVLEGGSATAVAPRLTAVGTARCGVVGKVRFMRGVTNSPASVVWKLRAKLACSEGTTGSPTATVRAGKILATTAPTTRSCATTSMPAVDADIKWSAKGAKVDPTHIRWSGGTNTASSPVTTALPASASVTVSGSYANSQAVANLVSAPVSFAPCATRGGMKRYLLAGGSTLTLTPRDATNPPSGVCNNGLAAPAQYQKVVVFSFENRTWSSVGGAGFGSMPYLHSLAQSCSFFSSWTETNTSQNSLTQYGGQVTGAFQSGLVNDCSPSATCSTTADNIFRQARAAGKTAINYVEGATTGCSASGNAAKHIPSLYMWGADDRAFCTAQTRPYSEFNPNNPPNFAFITPTQCNDGHDCSNSTVDSWARTNVQPVLDSAAYQAGQVAVFIWYDEDAPVPNMQIAPTARPGPFGTSGIGYASTLKAWQSMLGFPCLANACTAPDLRGVAGI